MKENFINNTHQLDILYRRWDVEENICRYFIEHYLTVLEKGPPSMLRRFSLKSLEILQIIDMLKIMQKHIQLKIQFG